jgi:NADPH-dependent 2,4-dienoyl-CoA reductase/sulfur reductase-like enzyme
VGLEVAAVLAQLGVGTTVIHRGDRLLEKFACDEVSTFFEQHFADHGVHVAYEDEAVSLNGNSRLESVTTKVGRTLPCHFACAGIGVFSDTSYLDGSGLKLENGVVVDEFLRASQADVFAAGDIANYYDTVFEHHRRIEHWDNAIRQGRTAARNMAGLAEPFNHLSYFYSTLFGMTYEFYGDMSEYDDMVVRGSFDNRSCAVLYLHQGVLKAALLFQRPASERRAIVSLITGRKQLGPVLGQLADERFMLEDALA